jgi:hypothetical protein
VFVYPLCVYYWEKPHMKARIHSVLPTAEKERYRRFGSDVIFVDTNIFVYAVGRPHPPSVTRHPGLSARDLLHLACCRRRGVERIHIFDRGRRAAIEKG